MAVKRVSHLVEILLPRSRGHDAQHIIDLHGVGVYDHGAIVDSQLQRQCRLAAGGWPRYQGGIADQTRQIPRIAV